MTTVEFVETVQEQPWQVKTLTANPASTTASLKVTTETKRTFEGFGSCFNELGMKAILQASPADQEKIFDQLFGKTGDCRFNLCRLPIGANDYALDWYSFDEHDEDYDLEQFSIERDMEYIIPYIKAALKRNPDIVLTASPWSPPTWMKTIKVYNNGTIRWEPKVLTAYANYFVKFVKAYQEAGITIHQVHVQNEVVADQKFPSCVWTGAELRDFIGQYLGPAFEKAGLTTEIWLGTINAPEPYKEIMKNETQSYDVYASTVLRDPDAYRYTAGVGYQWAGKNAIQRTVEAYPEKRFLQTENECGNGQNTWLFAQYVYNLFRHYIVNGANGYMYWNAVLQPGGKSTWGWGQNAMITVDEQGAITYNPEFYVMKHFSHYIQKGAKRLVTTGHDTADAVAFENPDGSIAVVIANNVSDDHAICLDVADQQYTVTLKANSFNTFLIQK